MKKGIRLFTGKGGFTLLELLMVMIIIGILATLAVPQYLRFIEKSRASEAVGVLGAVKTAEGLYKLEHGSYAGALGDLDITVPTGAVYWTYAITAADATTFTAEATRTALNAAPTVIGQTITLSFNDATGAVTWGGSHDGVPG